MGKKVTREEFERLEKHCSQNSRDIVDNQNEIVTIERDLKIAKQTINNLQPKIAEMRAKDQNITRIAKELEEQTVRNVELRTRLNKEVQDGKALYDFIKDKELEEEYLKFLKKRP